VAGCLVPPCRNATVDYREDGNDVRASADIRDGGVRCIAAVTDEWAPTVWGLHLPKVLKNTTNMFSSIVYCHRKVRP
jgi:hypothetical protein